MGNIKRKYDGLGVFELNINPKDYANHPDYSPFSVFRRVETLVDDTEPVQVDSMRLMLCFQDLLSKDFKYYFYVLGMLKANNIPIPVDLSEMRKFTKDKYTSVTFRGLERCVKQGLLFKVPNRTSQYLVNPVFAWKGNRLDYLDPAAFSPAE
ncbi:hypothetical protein [Dyadobacter sp. CY312]|uniref:hypothetical protein n=1 Tax=Dyadobacter sp. CY312 TaxID=2907303 RepID=UPI001F405271|nr:hypothetical protein [Dyadobacter sp. CY312]MCE7039193.1 hypothetical protein [Dyadobacter sp. CY312]